MAAFYQATTCRIFSVKSSDEILGSLLRSYQHNELQKRQTKAWQVEIKVLKSVCDRKLCRHAPAASKWSLLLEYPGKPRRNLTVNWVCLDLPPDVRSSDQLEVAASEFECQGLELDWVGVCWGGDFPFNAANSNWLYQQFSGSKWGKLKNEVDRQFLLNTYRVLLTRARRGLIIWVPPGDFSDPTRSPSLFDPTADYLVRCGLQIV